MSKKDVPAGVGPRSLESMPLLPVWVDPNHWVGSARLLLTGHSLRAIGVVQDSQLVGILRQEAIQSAGDRELVSQYMEPVSYTIDGSLPPREAANEFVERKIDLAPVMKEGRFLGIATANMLLRELGRSWDPLTGLSWSDYLRQWGVERLREGEELTILFIDLDNFKQYNTKYGHIIGDKVLRRVAAYAAGMLDADRDVVVRYGGDEFAIATIRPRSEAEALAKDLLDHVEALRIPEAEEAITFVVGIFGGKRSRERDNVHFAATLDNLINFASRDAMAQKASRKVSNPIQAAPPSAPVTPAKPTVIDVTVDESDSAGLTKVLLMLNGHVVSGVKSIGESVLVSVANATLRALGEPDSQAFEIEEVSLFELDGYRAVSVRAVGPDGPVSAERQVDGDLYRVVAQTTLALAFS